ncbi:MAG: ATP-binding protein [Bacteroidales bacterium]|nr:ATP-binding protein [Bacteroidales bacterium]
MKRLLINDLLKWKNNPDRKPLILNGARQVGKTWLLQNFGKGEYKSVAYINCERAENLDFVFEDFDTRRIIMAMSAMSGIDILPSETLIIIDEIQEYPRALTALKYFCEDAPKYHVAVAGSLLDIMLHSGVSFPVGKVNMLNLYPMNFEEFLMAMGKEQALQALYSGDWKLINALAPMYIDLLRQYYYVGGMPAVVKSYTENASLMQVREIQKQILFDYSHDFSKHTGSKEIPRINLIWSGIPSQLAKENKKFQYSEIKKGGRASEFELAIQWLVDMGLVYKVQRITEPCLPLHFYAQDNVFKLFMLDVGLLGAMMDVRAADVIVNDDIFVEYKGAFTEEFVLTQLVSKGITAYYYSTNDSRVEIDFVLQDSGKVLPVEVKAEENVHSKSLRTFVDKHPDLKGIRLSMKPYIDQDWMENIPLYALTSLVGNQKKI